MHAEPGRRRLRIAAISVLALGPIGITVILDKECGEGLEVTLSSPQRSFSTLIPQFTHGGVHALQVVVGTNLERMTVRATARGQQIFENEFAATPDRQTVFITGCDQTR